MSFSRKTLEIQVTLASGSFGGKGNTKIISGLATEVSIERPGLPDKDKATIRIYNLPLSDMEQLTTLSFKPLEARKNIVRIFGGEENNLSEMFSGDIVSAFGDFNSAPDPVFEIQSMCGYHAALTPSRPSSFSGSTQVATIVKNIAMTLGYSFINHGVSASLKNVVLNGSLLEQAISAAKHAGANILVNDNTITLVNRGEANPGNAVLLNKNTGLIGYPVFNNEGIVVKSLYNQNFKFNGLIQVESIVPKASGTWKITKLNHTLSANNTAGGEWVSNIEASYLG